MSNKTYINLRVFLGEMMYKNRNWLFFVALLLFSGLGYCFAFRASRKIDKFDIKNIFENENITPVLVIGSGPAALMASVYGARGGKKTFLVEGNKPGGLLMDTTEVANWPGEKMIEGPRIIEKLRDQARHQGVQFIQDQVDKIDTDSWPYEVYLESGTVLQALTIIIATGASPRKLGVAGEENYWGSGVTSCAVCDAPFFKGENVVVAGGGDSAIEEAIQLSSFAAKVTVLVRKDQMRAADSMQSRLKNYPKIDVKYNVEIKKIVGNLESVTGVELYNNRTQETELFATSGVFLAIGHIPNSGFVKKNIRTDKDGYILVNYPYHATSVPGIFAAGDIADKIYRQAVTSAGSGTEAALDAVRFLDDHGYSNQVAHQVASQFYTSEVVRSQVELLSISSRGELQNLIASNEEKLIVLDFWTETCSSCKELLQSIKKVYQSFANNILFISIDADEATDLVEAFAITRVPTLVTLKNGVVFDKYTGFLGKKELHAYLEKMLSEATLKDKDPVESQKRLNS